MIYFCHQDDLKYFWFGVLNISTLPFFLCAFGLYSHIFSSNKHVGVCHCHCVGVLSAYISIYFLQNWFTINVFHYFDVPLAYIPDLCFCIEQCWIIFVGFSRYSYFLSSSFLKRITWPVLFQQAVFKCEILSFFWNLFRMNYFMTILVFPKLFVFVLFSYVVRLCFCTWLQIILVALPPPSSSSKGNRLQ